MEVGMNQLVRPSGLSLYFCNCGWSLGDDLLARVGQWLEQQHILDVHSLWGAQVSELDNLEQWPLEVWHTVPLAFASSSPFCQVQSFLTNLLDEARHNSIDARMPARVMSGQPEKEKSSQTMHFGRRRGQQASTTGTSMQCSRRLLCSFWQASDAEDRSSDKLA